MEGWTEEEIRNKNLRAPCGIFCGGWGRVIMDIKVEDRSRMLPGKESH